MKSRNLALIAITVFLTILVVITDISEIDVPVEAIGGAHVKNILIKVNTSSEEGFDNNNEKFHLFLTIERTLRYMIKVNAIADRLENEGYRLDPSVQSNLEKINSSSRHIKLQLEHGEITPQNATEEISEIRDLIDQTIDVIRSTTMKEHKQIAAKRFLERTLISVQRLNERVDKLKGHFDAVNVAMTIRALGILETNIEEIRQDLLIGKVEQAIDDLVYVVIKIDTSYDDLDDQRITSVLKNLNRVEARINILKFTTNGLLLRGLDTSNLDEEIFAIEGILEEIKEKFEEDDTKAAEELLDSVMEHLQIVSRNIQDLQERVSESGSFIHFGDVSVNQAKQLIDRKSSMVVLDVRTEEEYETEHIEGAINFWVDVLLQKINELDPNREYLVYCRLGLRSTRATQILNDNGFLKVFNLVGGIEAWKQEGYPLKK
jgi:rhodanese-related sulfurtransferase